MPQLSILPFKKQVTLESDESILEALRRGGFEKVLNIEHLPLAEKTSFQDLFIENLNFPELVISASL
jgi:hypothetical protein